MENLAGTLRAVEHQLNYGEASEGDAKDIAWCAREVAEVATALEAVPDALKLRDALTSAVSPADALPKKPNG